MTDYRGRDLAALCGEALETLPVVVVTGMRQTGKTTFITRDPAFAGRSFATFDDLATLDAARKDPEGFLEVREREGPLTLDEAHKCPEILTAVKRRVDQRRRPGRYVLSGSANFALLRDVSESLAGRAVYLTLNPFNRREALGGGGDVPILKSFFEKPSRFPTVRATKVRPEEILEGGMPAVCAGRAKSPLLWFEGFVQTYLERDLRSLAQVADLMDFRKFLQITALRTGQTLNRSDFARDAGMPATTAGRYLGLLETSYLVRTLTPYLGNRSIRLVKSPKLYLTDSGLAAHLAGVRILEAGDDERLRGALYETYVAQNLASIIEAYLPGARLHYWCVQGRYEVDFVLEWGRDCLAIEVKSSGRWEDRHLRGLQAFLEVTPRCRAAVLAYAGTEIQKLGDRLWAVPLGTLLS